MNIMNMMMNVQFSCPERVSILLSHVCMWTCVFHPWANKNAPHLLVKRSVSLGARSIWNAQGFDSPFHPKFNCLAFIFSLKVTCSYALFHLFFIFLSIQKIITPKILIQLMCGFFHYFPHHVYFFMDIFSRFVHGWKK